MNCSIAETRSFFGNAAITLEQDGNEYYLCYTTTDGSYVFSFHYDNYNDSVADFMKISEAIVRSYYSDDDRIAMMR